MSNALGGIGRLADAEGLQELSQKLVIYTKEEKSNASYY
jgi:hypothetical protein